MPATLRYVLYIAVVGALGAALGFLIQLVTHQAGWWFVGLMAGAVFGAYYGYLQVTGKQR